MAPEPTPTDRHPDCPGTGPHGTYTAARRHGCRCPGPGLDSHRASVARSAQRRGPKKDPGSVTAPDFAAPAVPAPTHTAGDLERDLHARRDLACRGHDPELWHSVRPTDLARARRICRGCPAVDDCLTVALRIGDSWAILGGLGPDERRHIRGRGFARAAS